MYEHKDYQGPCSECPDCNGSGYFVTRFGEDLCELCNAHGELPIHCCDCDEPLGKQHYVVTPDGPIHSDTCYPHVVYGNDSYDWFEGTEQ